ncbi:MAG: electron transfer flavoprotein subunit alpha/FixB family protein [Deltaproteobacteria bacterium]|nr:electron transfer flavoprotein subunit alpha/FixB family protein [Deltaproteobacteria bacterium]
MEKIAVLVEHRQNEVRDITFEMLGKAHQLLEGGGEVIALFLGDVSQKGLLDQITPHAHRTVAYLDSNLKDFEPLRYQAAFTNIFENVDCQLILMGQTAFGMDFAPAIAAKWKIPFTTDVVDIEASEELHAIRQMYSGKVNAKVSLKPGEKMLCTVRAGAFPAEDIPTVSGELQEITGAIEGDFSARTFVEYLEAAVGDVDITQADIIVSVGRGIKDADNIPIAQELADALGGVVACSRPVADKKWLPKERQVGTSGKTVKPKVYIALGISGAFQHQAGMKGANTIIAVNKDPKAPIFSIAHYGIVDDLFKVVPALTEKVKELRG